MAHTLFPVARVLNTFLHVDIFTLAVSKTVKYLALVCRSISPLVSSGASDFVLPEFTSIYRAVTPGELALSVEETVAELSLVLVAVLELASTLAVIDFTDLSIFLVVDFFTCPILDNQLCQLSWQESHFG